VPSRPPRRNPEDAGIVPNQRQRGCARVESRDAFTLEGDANGAAHGDPSVYARKYTGKYEHRNIVGGIGHNLPQEAPKAFAQAVIDVDKA
jgi:hypothetical protein